jgi:hypothetical protein
VAEQTELSAAGGFIFEKFLAFRTGADQADYLRCMLSISLIAITGLRTPIRHAVEQRVRAPLRLGNSPGTKQRGHQPFSSKNSKISLNGRLPAAGFVSDYLFAAVEKL